MQPNLLNLDGRIVVIAGAAGGGLGTTLARLVAQMGATVIAADRTQAKIDRDIQPLIDEGLSIIPVVADVETPEGIDAVMACARKAPGKLYGLIPMVGGGPAATWSPATKVTRENWHMLFSKNLDSMFFMTQAFVVELQAQRLPGAVVAISSIAGEGAQPYNLAYATAKGAILTAVRTLALELAADNIRVNAVAPGAMIGPKSLLQVNPELERRAIPMGRQGSHLEVAQSILFLLSDMASYVTGQCLTVDGGITTKGPHLAEDNTPVLITNEGFLRAMKGE